MNKYTIMLLFYICFIETTYIKASTTDITAILPLGGSESHIAYNTSLEKRSCGPREFSITIYNSSSPDNSIIARLECYTPPALYKETTEVFQANESRITLYYKDLIFYTEKIEHSESELTDFITWFSSLLTKTQQRRITPIVRHPVGLGGDFWQYIPIEGGILVPPKPEMTELHRTLTRSQGWQLIAHLLQNMPALIRVAMIDSWTRIMAQKSPPKIVYKIPGSSPLSQSYSPSY